MIKVLIATSEAVPFIKTGGLADVTGALPKYFDKSKYDVRVILPKYACINESLLGDLRFITNFQTNLGWRRQYVGVFEAVSSGVTYYFIDNEFYFNGTRPYGAIYEDAEKFAYFSKAVIDALPTLGFKPDIIHCNDWQTGLIPVFLKEEYANYEYYKDIKTVYSIHNMRFQGRWRLNEVRDVTGLPDRAFTAEGIECYGESNFLKGGIVYSDAFSTVSPTYAKEIASPEGGEGLDGLVRSYENKLFGILNGIDTEINDPKTDTAITYNYDVNDFKSIKFKNKEDLQRELGLPVDPNVFMIGIVSRLTDQKGFDLIAYILNEFLSSENVQFVILGSGEEKHENMFTYFSKKYPDKLAAYIGYSESLAQRIYASSDAFLMPSLFEPCGLSQLISMRYGTVPIVRETGGLADTVEPYNEYEGTGTGFSFSEYNAHDMMHVIRYAMNIYYSRRNDWDEIVKRGMEKDFSWNVSVNEYCKMYDSVL